MKNLIRKPNNFTSIEFWGVTTFFVFVIFLFITNALDNTTRYTAPNKRFFDAVHMPFHFYSNYFTPLLVQYITFFSAFVVLNFIIVPKLIAREAVAKNVILIVLIFLLYAFVDGITDTWIKGYLYARNNSRDAVEQGIFTDSFLHAIRLLMLFAFYTLVRYTGIYLVSNSKDIEKKYSFINRDGITAFVIWMMGMFLFIAGRAEKELIAAWAIIPNVGILFYWLSFYSLIPKSLGKSKAFGRYIIRTILVQAGISLPVFVLNVFMTGDEDPAGALTAFNFAFQILITAPLSWVLFKRQIKTNEELYVLRKELGRSNANLDFLRSQINPHFLFNALNTIYGTAIQEKAERTGEGIQKLGDMMRFMLQENMQEKIPLAREIDYLNNYISLQKLRTDPDPCIQIKTEVQNRENSFRIAPMLLIPFVENAFKHGISFREASHIKVTLEIKNNTLYFDVYNSKHDRPVNDPEQDKSGIGLENVKQRLKLLYYNRHELVIRETTKEFFVHLTIQLA